MPDLGQGKDFLFNKDVKISTLDTANGIVRTDIDLIWTGSLWAERQRSNNS